MMKFNRQMTPDRVLVSVSIESHMNDPEDNYISGASVKVWDASKGQYANLLYDDIGVVEKWLQSNGYILTERRGRTDIGGVWVKR